MKKYVYLFEEGNGTMRDLLGGKGANLAEMRSLGLPVPNGFTVTTEACNAYYSEGLKINDEILKQIFTALEKTEKSLGKRLGDVNNPLLVSVRSGARASMPGMMDTILNLGLNDETVEGLAKLTGNPRFAFDSYRRFIQMFSDVVMDVKKSLFEEIFDKQKEVRGVHNDTDLDANDLRKIVSEYKALYKKIKGVEFPQDPKVQLTESITAVFRSWDNERAIYYRRMNDIPSSWGTAVNVQSMVFGNMGETSGTGVAFTRNPSTGEKKVYGEYLMNAQGEDVVAGIRTPMLIASLEKQNPEVYAEFIKICDTLEKHYKDMQDMEFTIEKGKLYMLQTRNGKRTAAAALRIAIDLVKEGMLTKKEAVLRIDAKQLDALLHPQFDAAELKNTKHVAQGLNASPGAACGHAYVTAKKAVKMAAAGQKVIIVRTETSPEDIEGMNVSDGILTSRGGMTSHAAVVARGMGRCCVAGCGAVTVYENEGYFTIAGKRYNEGDIISLDGDTGYVYGQEIKTKEAELTEDFSTIMEWADEYRSLKVRTNADSPKDALKAIEFGAQGIGLTRTEHMFFDKDRIMPMREMILAETVEARKTALNKLLPMQRKDFEGIYEAMHGRPVTIRLLDPPLHEFLPKTEEDNIALVKDLHITLEELAKTVSKLHEFNPMMGHRGCRLSVTFPEITEMQTRAIIEAAINVSKRNSYKVVPEIMIPLICDIKEFDFIKKIVEATIKLVLEENNYELKYLIGTMIELPRAALTADAIAKSAEFFSFGTNDLTQMTYGFSRDDAGKFLDEYYGKKIFESDPFARLDKTGVGELVKIACERGKSSRPDIKLGICGEHGGDPSSVEFCHNVGLEYVSCSPFRVPIARLAAAQANLKNPRK